jgi:hypothetical protein
MLALAEDAQLEGRIRTKEEGILLIRHQEAGLAASSEQDRGAQDRRGKPR